MAHSKVVTPLIATDIENKFVTDVDKDNWNLKFREGYNHIINGNFDIWQRATSQTSAGYGSDDRWINFNVGSTKTHSRQAFTLGQTFPDGVPTPKYYSRTVVTSVAAVGNYCIKQQRIEFVRTLAGKKAVLSFYAKANATKNMSIEVLQHFGSGGTPSAVVLLTPQKITVTSVWQKFDIYVNIPSITGKVLGTNNDDGLHINFWFEAGSNWNTRTASLGQQSGTFDLAHISLLEGDAAIKSIPRTINEEMKLCLRYYEVVGMSGVIGYGYNNYSLVGNFITFTVTKRIVPVITQGTILENVNASAIHTDMQTINGFRYWIVNAAAGRAYLTRPIYIDAEL